VSAGDVPADDGRPAGLPADVPPGGELPDGPQDRPSAELGGRWPGVLPFVPAGPGTLGGVQPLAGRGGAGLLSLAVPLGTLAGAPAPGELSRLGVISAAQARQLAEIAAGHPATRWQVIVTSPAGEAVAVTAIPRSRSPGPVAGGESGVGLVGRVRLIIRTDQLGTQPGTDPAAAAHGPPPPGLSPPGPVLPAGLLPAGSPLAPVAARALAAAGRAWAAEARRQRDAGAGGCAHALASAAYRPPPRIAALVTARDQTCRFGPCRRPASQCDLDHDVPFDQGGLTCPCNIGGKCRRHHQLKQHPRWTVTQPEPGTFRWTTPAGRTYTTRPDPYVT
jgi:hypothetical protein